MSFASIFTGRMPGPLIARRVRLNIQQAQQSIARLQQQAATGQRFFLPGEDPGSAVRTIVLQKMLERNAQLQANVRTDKAFLNTTEASLLSVGDAINTGKSFVLSGVGSTTSPAEKEAMAVETRSLVKSVVNSANSLMSGRYLFGGSESKTLPFEFTENGLVRYNGDKFDIESFIDFDYLLPNNMHGDLAFSALSEPVGSNLDPALTLDTSLSDLNGGLGIPSGSVVVTIDDGVNPAATQTVDLSGAETVRDVKTLLEDAFAPGPPTLTVDIDPASSNGLRLTPSGGTVSVTDLSGATVARDLGIASGPAAVINGGDLDPQITLLTPLSALNNGTGIGPTAGNGLLITNGPKSEVVDISSAVTVEDLFNTLEAADLDLYLDINEAGNGLAISTRLSGANFSIGENNGNNATLLGIRTMTGETLLADLNLGTGVPTDGPEDLVINRRDGTQANVSLAGLNTVQDVIDAINAVDPGVLVASLNSVGNGITIVDDDGVSTGPLEVVENTVSTALGIDGIETGTDPSVPLVGRDVNPRQVEGAISLLLQLETALINEDDQELARLDPLFDKELERFNLARAELGIRMKTLDQAEERLLDADVNLQTSLSEEFDADLTEVITQIATINDNLTATLQIAATALQLSLFNFI